MLVNVLAIAEYSKKGAGSKTTTWLSATGWSGPVPLNICIISEALDWYWVTIVPAEQGVVVHAGCDVWTQRPLLMSLFGPVAVGRVGSFNKSYPITLLLF